MKLTPLNSSDTDTSKFDVKPSVRKHSSVDIDFIDVGGIKQQYPHLQPFPLKKYS